LLRHFFSGADGSLPDRLLAEGSRPCRFVTQWQEADAAELREFFARRQPTILPAG
jgi:hypothetical protein